MPTRWLTPATFLAISLFCASAESEQNLLKNPGFDDNISSWRHVEDQPSAPGMMPGWRIRYTSELFGPHDRVHVWYGRQGFLRLAYHVESDATDPNGNVIGTAVAEETQELRSLSLVKPAQLAGSEADLP